MLLAAPGSKIERQPQSVVAVNRGSKCREHETPTLGGLGGVDSGLLR